MVIRWAEHNNISKKSELSKNMLLNLSVLLSTPKSTKTRKYLRAFSISKMEPSLNEQVQANALNLFRHGLI